MPEITRNIYFYRIDAGTDPSGQPLSANLHSLLQSLEALPFEEDSGRYLSDKDRVYCSWVDSTTKGTVRFALVRRRDLPMVEQAGSLAPLSMPVDAGLCETIHLRLFSGNIVGADFNFYGPRATRFPWYLKRVLPSNFPPFSFEALIHPDIAAQLQRLNAVKALELKVRRDFITQVEAADQTLGRALRTAASLGDPQVVGVILQPEPHKRSPLGGNVLRTVTRLLRRPQIDVGVVRFNLVGIDAETEETVHLDLLRQHLVGQRRIAVSGDRVREVEANSAYRAIRDVYQEMRETIERAASIGP